MNNVRGWNALVTGGGKGIGRMVANGLSQLGAKVFIVSRSNLEQQAKEIGNGCVAVVVA